jgi:hypothetical protein
VSIFVDFALVTLFVTLMRMAVISGFILSECIKEDDAVSAWVCLGSFVRGDLTRRFLGLLEVRMKISPGARKDGRSLFFTLYIKQLFVSSTSKLSERRTMDLFDVEAVERAEAELDNFISKRSREREEANRVEAAWAESTRRHRHKVRLANGYAWVEYFDHLALCHERRADEFRDRSREVSGMVKALAAGEGELT